MADSAKPLKVCHVFAGAEGGRWVFEQARAQARDYGCDVTVVLGAAEGATVDLCREAGLKVKALDFKLNRLSGLFSPSWRLVDFALWMRRERFDVVQSHVIQSTFFARPAAWLADVPVRLEMVTSPFHFQAKSLLWIEKATGWMETGIIPSCNLVGEILAKEGFPTRLAQKTLYYGPEEHRFDPATAKSAGIRKQYGWPSDTPIIACVAIFYQKMGFTSWIPHDIKGKHMKGHVDLIAAMPTILKAFPKAKMLFVGKGWFAPGEAAEAEIRALVKEAGLEDSIIFTGFRTDVANIYMDVDVSVQPSLNENLGGTVESLLMARPTVVTRVGGLTDSVIDGVTGVVVERENPVDLARGIIELLSDRPRAKALGEAGRALMLERFTLKTTARELVELYRRQRAEAPGAWRLHAFWRRLVFAGFHYVFVVAPVLVAEVYGPVYWARGKRLVKRIMRGPVRG